VIAQKRSHGFGVHTRDLFLAVAVAFLDEVIDKEGNVLFAFAQGRDPDGQNIEAIEEILPERPDACHRGKILVCGRNDSHIHFDGFFAAHLTKLAGLIDPQEFRLKRQAEFPDLVQKQRPSFVMKRPVSVGRRR
jgi:hypothetical protein